MAKQRRGYNTSAGAPTSGYHEVGARITDGDGVEWVCTVAGEPGTFVNQGTASDVVSGAILPTVAAGDAYKNMRVNAADDGYEIGFDFEPITFTLAIDAAPTNPKITLPSASNLATMHRRLVMPAFLFAAGDGMKLQVANASTVDISVTAGIVMVKHDGTESLDRSKTAFTVTNMDGTVDLDLSEAHGGEGTDVTYSNPKLVTTAGGAFAALVRIAVDLA